MAELETPLFQLGEAFGSSFRQVLSQATEDAAAYGNPIYKPTDKMLEQMKEQCVEWAPVIQYIFNNDDLFGLASTNQYRRDTGDSGNHTELDCPAIVGAFALMAALILLSEFGFQDWKKGAKS